MSQQSQYRNRQSSKRTRSLSGATRSVIEALEQRVFLAANPIVEENLLPGSPWEEWYFTGAGDLTIQGYATDISVDQGQTVNFKIDDKAAAPYRIDVYRMGYYQGNGARKVATMHSTPATQIAQPAPLFDATTGMTDAGNWSVTDSWSVPTTATSGIYFAKVTREDTGGASYIVFVVRDDDGGSDLLFQTSDTTWHAYNNYGGKSLYDHQSTGGKAVKVSYNRPFLDRNNDGINSFVFTSEYPMVRWLEANGYDVSYFTGVDSARLGAEMLEHNAFLSVGHDEYWSGEMRTNVTAARDAGVNLAFFTANEGFWKVRWENSIDGSGTPYRTLVCYKESDDGAKTDPTSTWTGMWRDPRFSPPSDGGLPENELTGTLFAVNSMRNDPIHVSADDGNMRFWRNTSIADLPSGGVATLPNGVLGYEWDIDADNGFRPAGLIDLSHTTISVPKILASQNVTYAPGTATHSLTMYRASSGALVFGAGTVQWSWGLDAEHDRSGTPSDARMQQATVNLFADMGVSAGSLQTGLVQTTASADTTAPTSALTWSPDGLSLNIGDIITITGTSTDTGGGIVGGVEVSVDGGASWHPAVGRENWQYTWRVTRAGTAHIMTRATDDSLRMETPGPGVTATVAGQNGISIWSDRTIPFSAPLADSQVATSGGVEFGLKFRSDETGQVLGVRFYKMYQNTGVHTGSLWTSTGELLAQATFANETPEGWQEVRFSSPVTINAGQTYVISYHTTDDYSADDDYFFANSGVDSGPLHALASGIEGGNGVYKYGAGGFPNQTFHSANYYVDVVFTSNSDITAPTLTLRNPAAGATGVPTNATVSATFSEDIDPATASLVLRDAANAVVAGTTSYNAATRVLTFTPSSALNASATYSVTVSGAEDLAGNVMTSVTWSFTTVAADITAPTITSRTPASGATGVPVGTTVSVTFSEAIDPATALFEVRDSANALVAGSTSYNAATRVLTFTPGAALSNSATYSVTVSGAADLAGNVMTSVNWSFTTAAPSTGELSIWTLATVPSGTAITDPTTISSGGVTLGMRFNSDVSGQVTGMRFYKNSANTGTHVASLWDSAGNLLAQATFTSETSSGWQQVYFSTPVNITAGQTYTVSYHTTTDRWRRTLDYFTSPVVSGPLHATGGFYIYGASSTYPTNSYRSSNYWADVIFVESGAPDTTAPTLTAQTPASGATGVATNSTVSVTFSEDINAATASLVLRDAANAVVPGTTSYNATTRVLTFTPSAALSPSATYSVTVSGATDLAGNVMTSVNWSFTTVAADTTAPTLTAQTPAPGATGVPTTATVSVTFSEVIDPATASLVVRDAANAIVAGTTNYNATTRVLTFTPNSALNPSATYSVTVSGAADLAGNVMTSVNWSLTTAAADTIAPTLTAQNPAPGATGVPTGATVSVTFSEDINPATALLELRDSANVLVAGTTSYNAATRVLTFTPSATLSATSTYSVTVSGAADLAGNVMTSVNWSFTTAAASTADLSIWSLTTTPSGTAVSDPTTISSGGVTLGMIFNSDVSGFVKGVRFYKNSANTGTHVASLWDSAGNLLAQATFTSETASGWQQVYFSTPVAITAGQSYTVSYHTTTDRWRRTLNYFTSPVTSGPLHATAGRYIYGATSAFPTNSYSSSNYWADVIFTESAASDTTAPTLTAQNPASGAANVPVSTTVSVTFSEDISPATALLEVRDGANALVAGTSSYNAATRVLTFTPSASLNASATYTVTVSGAADLAGNVMTSVNWSFTTAAADTTAPALTAQNPASGATGVPLSATVSVTFSEDITPATALLEVRDAANALVAGATSYNAATRVLTFTPSASLSASATYTVTVSGAADLAGNVMTSVNWSFTTAAAAATEVSIWTLATVPSGTAITDPTTISSGGVTLGMRFSSDVSGQVTGVRFYKNSANTGTHVASLWDSAGNLLAQATFVSETASGWQQVYFSTPVTITAGQTYTVSYHTTTDRWRRTLNYFASPVTSGPLHATGGVYAYGATSTYPTSSYQASNYWVDVIFVAA